MIRSIEEIRKIGCFESFKWNGIPNFDRFNFMFGFNGSGKTTISNIFNLISSKSNYTEEKKKELYDDIKIDETGKVKFRIINDQSLTYPPSENQNNQNIYVFNSNFVSDHVYDGTTCNLKKFNVASAELKDPKILKITDEIKSKEKLVSDLDKEIGTIDDSYISVKKDFNSEFRSHFPNKNLSIDKAVPNKDQIPNDSIENIKTEIKLRIKEFKLAKNQKQLDEDIQIISTLKFEKIYLQINEVETQLKDTVTKIATDSLVQKINDFQENFIEDDKNEVEPWFKFGNELLKKISLNDVKYCPLCNSNIDDKFSILVKSFSAYFDKEFESFIENINTQISNIESQLEKIQSFKSNYGVLFKQYVKYSDFLNSSPSECSVNEVILQLSDLKDQLISKRNNSNNSILLDPTIIVDHLLAYNQDVEELETYTNTLKENVYSKKKSPEAIEVTVRGLYKLLIYKTINSTVKGVSNYYEKTEKKIKTSTEINLLIEEKVQRLKELKIEAKKVGEYLIRLGINHFTIDLNEDKESDNILIKYKSHPQIKTKLKNSLSEGEKTALAFAYFLSKVSIEVQKPNETIIMIDDPISSLDDNRIYNTAFIIYDIFKNYKQVFILSHNFLFLKYMFPQFKNEKKSYLISHSKIEQLPNSIQNFQTPYYYMIESILNFVGENEKNYEEARKFLPNYIRRVLETFFSFKYAKLKRKNTDQSPGLDDFIKDYIDFNSLPDTEIELINKDNIKDKLLIINGVCDNFSHGNLQQLENQNFITDETLELIAKDCLSIIEFFDGFHFTKIKELVPVPDAD